MNVSFEFAATLLILAAGMVLAAALVIAITHHKFRGKD